MVVCKFFFQGTCKFGEYCKFDHQVPGNNYTSFTDSSAASTSILRQSNFGAPQATPTRPTNVDTTALVNAVVNDMTQAEKGGQWLFSSYAPFKEKPAFSGFSDQSFEEIRLGYYEAQKSGSVEQYKQQLQVMLQELMGKVKALQNPSPDIVNVLKLIYNTPPSSCSGVFGNTTTSTTVFANTGTSGNVFSQQNTGFTPQANSNSMFAKPTQSVLGNNTQTSAQSSSIFGGRANSNTTSIFAGANQQQSIFATQTPNAAPIFQSNQQQSNSPFVQSSFATQPNVGIFAQANQSLNKPPSIFGANTQPNQSMFAQQQPTNSPFAQQQSSTSPFAQQQSTTSPFAQQQSSTSPFAQPQSTTSPFAQPQSTTSPFAQQQSTNSPFAQQQSSVFAKPTQSSQLQPGSSPFAQPQSNIFAAQPQQQTPIFAAPTQNVSPLSTQQPQPQASSIFGSHTTPQASPFVTTQAQLQNQNLFSQNLPKTDTASAMTHSASIFGSNVLQNPTIGQQSQQETAVDMSIYSRPEELTEVEKKWFQSEDFDIANIPENPPSYELVC